MTTASPLFSALIPPALDGARVDRAVATLWGLPTATARRLGNDRRIRVQGRVVRSGDRVVAGHVLSVDGLQSSRDLRSPDSPSFADWFLPAPPLPVLFVDDDVVVVDKPAGMSCHPLVPQEGGTVLDAVVAAFPEVALAGPVPREGGLLHRLDLETSGCLALARSGRAFAALATVVRGDGVFLSAATPSPTPWASTVGGVQKVYLAIVEGVVDEPMVIESAIDHDRSDPRRMRVVTVGGKAARTIVMPRSRGQGTTLVELGLQGGRRHQLRVHLAAQGRPLLGDVLYGASSPSEGPFLLHAWRLQLPGRVAVTAPLPHRWRDAARQHGLRLPESS
jgi:23S rRNA pseudouridine1911/1915/1917 synthase